MRDFRLFDALPERHGKSDRPTTTGAALLEYLFKAKAVGAFGPGDHLLRFFALYYAGTSVIMFFLQAFSSRAVLERFGLALTTSTPSIALLAGSIGSLVAPGFGGLVVARGGGFVRLAIVFVPAAKSPTILTLAVATSVGAIIRCQHTESLVPPDAGTQPG